MAYSIHSAKRSRGCSDVHHEPASKQAACWVNRQILSIAEDRQPTEEKVETLWRLFIFNKEIFDAINTTTLVYSLAKMGGMPNPLSTRATALIYQVLKMKSKLNARNLSNIVYSYAKGGVRNKELFRVFTQEILSRKDLYKWNPQDISNTLYAYAISGMRDEELFRAFAREIVCRKDLYEWKTQEISNTLYAYAISGMRDKELFSAVAKEIISRKDLHKWELQHISNTLYAYTISRMRDEELFRVFAREVASRKDLCEWKPQNISNTLYAYAISGVRDKELFRAFARKLTSIRDWSEWKPQEISNALYAYAISGMGDINLFEKLADVITENRDVYQWNSQDISNILYAYAISGIRDKELFRVFARELTSIRDWSKWKLQEISNTLYAYAISGMGDIKLFEQLADVITKSRDVYKWNSQDISNTVYAYVLFLVSCTQEISARNVDDIKQLCVDLLKHLNPREGTKENIVQAMWTAAYFGLQEYIDSLASYMPQSPSGASKLEQDVEYFLLLKGFQADVGLGPSFAYHHVDFCRQDLCIEVDGPSHFYKDTQNPLPKTLLRNAILRRGGKHVVCINYMDWDRLNDDESKRAYIELLLDKACL